MNIIIIGTHRIEINIIDTTTGKNYSIEELTTLEYIENIIRDWEDNLDNISLSKKSTYERGAKLAGGAPLELLLDCYWRNYNYFKDWKSLYTQEDYEHIHRFLRFSY